MALPKLIRAAEYGNVFELWQDPKSSARDYTYINDMMKAIEHVINHPNKYEIMNLGNSNPIENKNYGKLLAWTNERNISGYQ